MSERGQMRRRLREQLRVREALLLDLGALVYELHRQGRRAPELLQEKAAELTVVDEEVRELQAALDGREEPARETTEVEAVEEHGEEGPLEEEEDALDEEDVALDNDDEPLGQETGEESTLDEELDEDEPRAGDETGEADELAPDDDQPTLAEHEEPRA